MFTGYELILLDIFIVNMAAMLFVLYYLKKCYSCCYAELIPIKCLAALSASGQFHSLFLFRGVTVCYMLIHIQSFGHSAKQPEDTHWPTGLRLAHDLHHVWTINFRLPRKAQLRVRANIRNSGYPHEYRSVWRGAIQASGLQLSLVWLAVHYHSTYNLVAY